MCNHQTNMTPIYLPPNNKTYMPTERRVYCSRCGLVREHGGRGLAYFIDRLQEVQHMLQGRLKRLGVPPLTQAERRLIVRALEEDPLFADPYGSLFDVQIDRFIKILRRQRPNIPEWMFEDILT